MRTQMRQKNVRSFFSYFLFVNLLFWGTRADAYCFIFLDSLTYGASRDAENAGVADKIRTDDPRVEDIRDGGVILGNIFSTSYIELELTLADSSKALVTLNNSEAIGLTPNEDGYFIFRVAPLNKDVALDAETDVFAKGNWPYFYPDIKKDAVGGQEGGYLRIALARTVALGKVVSALAFKKVVEVFYNNDKIENGIKETRVSLRPSQIKVDAAHSPFSTLLFSELPVVACEQTNTCPVRRPVNVRWSLVRTN